MRPLEYTEQNLTLQNSIMVAVVASYLIGLWLEAAIVSDALSVPAGIAIGWAVERTKPAVA